MLYEQAQRTPPPQWVRVVGGWTAFQFAERRLPTLDEINAVAPDTPVFVHRATFILDQYSEDWMRNVAVMMTGTVDIVEQGLEFERAKTLLEAKFQQYKELFPIKEGDSVILCFKPTKAVTWDYILGEFREPH